MCGSVKGSKAASTVREIHSSRRGTALATRKSTDYNNCAMLHRHLNHEKFTPAAIDDVIARGKRSDWAELRRAALDDRAVLEKVLQVCRAHDANPYAQRHHFWKQYAERHLT